MYVVKRGWVWDGGCGWGGVGLGCWWWGRGSGVVGVGGKCTYGPQWRRRVVNGVVGGGGVVNGFRGVSDLQQGYHTVTVANRQEKYPRYRYFFFDYENVTFCPYSLFGLGGQDILAVLLVVDLSGAWVRVRRRHAPAACMASMRSPTKGVTRGGLRACFMGLLPDK